MQRVISANDGIRPSNYFPTGLMGTSDGRFIVEAINAAVWQYLTDSVSPADPS